MASTFFGLSIGASGLNAFHAAVNTTANNISNIQTEGYTRQQTNLETSESMRTYQRYGTMGTGVTAKSVTQMRDEYYDTKYWRNNAKYGEYERKYYYMEQIENYYTDSEEVQGFSRLYSKMFNALDSVKNSAGESAVRNEFISDAKEVCVYFNTKANQLSELQSTLNDEIKSVVGNINSIIDKITALNKQINVIEVQGMHANDLRDARNLLVDELSEIIPIEINEEKVINSNYVEGKTPRDMQYTGATLYTIKFNGRLLVDTKENHKLTTVTRDEKDNQSDIDGLYDVCWADSEAKIDLNGYNMTGSLRALFQIRDGNNEDNLKGTVTRADKVNVGGTVKQQVTIEDPSITDITLMNMPESGRLTINSTVYEYEGFSFETDKDGNITKYIFDLKSVVPDDIADSFVGSIAENGDGVNYKGIPYYQNQMNSFLRAFAKTFNDLETTGSYQYDAAKDVDNDGKVDGVGYDYYGNPAESFFVAISSDGKELDFKSTGRATDSANIEFKGTDKDKSRTGADALTSGGNTYWRLTASNIDVAKATRENPKLLGTTTSSKNNPDGVDAYDIVESLQQLQSDIILFRNCGGDDFLECIYSDVTVDTNQCKVFTENFENVKDTIEAQRTSISGVDEDEEALDLVKFQNAYNLSSKLISVLNEMYDRLILSTGV